MNPNDITLKHVQSAALKFLSAHHSSLSLPIPIEEITEGKLGVSIQLIPGIKALLGIDAFITANFKSIIIDEQCYTSYPQRTRFSIAHEIGHKILHSDWYNHHGPKNIQEAFSFQEQLDSQTYKFMEIQADTFAGLTLVPTSCLRGELEKLVGTQQKNNFLPPIYDLVDIFDVSDGVLLRRIEKEKLADVLKM